MAVLENCYELFGTAPIWSDVYVSSFESDQACDCFDLWICWKWHSVTSKAKSWKYVQLQPCLLEHRATIYKVWRERPPVSTLCLAIPTQEPGILEVDSPAPTVSVLNCLCHLLAGTGVLPAELQVIPAVPVQIPVSMNYEHNRMAYLMPLNLGWFAT